MKLVIDRFEGDFAVCELPDRTMVNIPKQIFENADCGDIINVTVDKDAIKKQKEKIEKLMDDIWED